MKDAVYLHTYVICYIKKFNTHNIFLLYDKNMAPQYIYYCKIYILYYCYYCKKYNKINC